MVYSKMASELDQAYTKGTRELDDDSLKEVEEFEEALAEAVYDELSLISNIVASALDICIQKATSVEIGLRKTRLNVNECEDLEKGLEKVFGFGAKVIECRILKALNTKIGVSQEIKQNFKFSDEVKTARKLYKSKRCAGNIR
jgi:hypothetical protein